MGLLVNHVVVVLLSILIALANGLKLGMLRGGELLQLLILDEQLLHHGAHALALFYVGLELDFDLGCARELHVSLEFFGCLGLFIQFMP